MTTLHNWQLKLYKLKIYIVCQDPLLRQIAAGIPAQGGVDPIGVWCCRDIYTLAIGEECEGIGFGSVYLSVA